MARYPGLLVDIASVSLRVHELSDRVTAECNKANARGNDIDREVSLITVAKLVSEALLALDKAAEELLTIK
jgi:hypothetical protein